MRLLGIRAICILLSLSVGNVCPSPRLRDGQLLQEGEVRVNEVILEDFFVAELSYSSSVKGNHLRQMDDW